MAQSNLTGRIRKKYKTIREKNPKKKGRKKSKEKKNKKNIRVVSNKYKKKKKKEYAAITIEKRLCINCDEKPEHLLPATIFLPWVKCPECKGRRFWFEGFEKDELPYIMDVTLKGGEKISIVRNRKAYKQIKRKHPERVCYALGELPELAKLTVKNKNKIHEIKRVFGGGILKVKKIGKCRMCAGEACKEDMIDGQCKECNEEC